MSSSSITGTNVKNVQGDSLGEIKDLMLNTHKGKIAYAVLSFGGWLGIGDKYFAIPFEAFSIDSEDDEFVLNVAKEKLEEAPGFDKDNWPFSCQPGVSYSGLQALQLPSLLELVIMHMRSS